MPLTLLTGGARSGKSALAIQAAAGSGRPVVFVATAEPRDAELAQRIDRHRAERPADWTVVEEPVALEAAIRDAPSDACLVVDCLSLWVANLLDRELSEADALGAARRGAETAATRAGPTIAVTNEVGSGVVPATPLGRLYRDLLGHVNRIWADAAEQAALVVAGRVLELRRWGGVEA
jgi:adenosylcobinamide kinase/adenosylcobinamide-phosphate guanylyltransferase